MENSRYMVALDSMPTDAQLQKRSARKADVSLDHLIDQAMENKVFPGIACGVWIEWTT